MMDRFFGGVGWIETRVREHFAATVVLGVVFVGLHQIWGYGYGTAVSRWDWLFCTGWLSFFISWPLALGLPDNAWRAITRLNSRHVLENGSGDALRTQIGSSAETWSRRIGLLTAGVVLFAFVVSLPDASLPGQVGFTVAATMAGLFVGRVFGWSIVLGRLGRTIERSDWTIRVQPGHIDGAAGLKPIGELYFRQSMILAIPALFLAVWWVLIPMLGRYESWRDTYFGLLLFVVGIEVLAFVAPMLAFHRIMRREKRRLLARADQESEKLQRLEQELPDITDDSRRQSMAEQARLLRERYLRLEHMPTWPVDASIWRRFQLNNVPLLLPVVAKTIGVLAPRGGLLSKLGEMISGGAAGK